MLRRCNLLNYDHAFIDTGPPTSKISNLLCTVSTCPCRTVHGSVLIIILEGKSTYLVFLCGRLQLFVADHSRSICRRANLHSWYFQWLGLFEKSIYEDGQWTNASMSVVQHDQQQAVSQHAQLHNCIMRSKVVFHNENCLTASVSTSRACNCMLVLEDDQLVSHKCLYRYLIPFGCDFKCR